MNPYYDSNNPNNWQPSNQAQFSQPNTSNYPVLNPYSQQSSYNSQTTHHQNHAHHHGHHHHGHHGHYGHHGHHDHHNNQHHDSKILIVIKTNEQQHKNVHHKPLFNPLQQYLLVSQLDESLCLDVSEDPKTIGQLVLWKKHGNKNQRFRIIENHGKYSIVSCATLNVLTVKNNSHHEGQHIYTYFNNGQKSQQWHFHMAVGKNDRFYISNGHGQYLDVFESKAKKGVPVIQWQYNGHKNQIWHLVPV